MKRTDSAKAAFYRVGIYLVVELIEERTGKKLATLDVDIERRIDNAIEYSNVKELKELHLALGEMYEKVKKRALIA
jgi:hypothetical protein